MVILVVYEIGSVCGTRGGVDSKWILGHVWSQCGKLSKDTKFYQDSSRNRIKTHLSSVSCSFIISELNAMHFLRLRHVMSYGFKMFNYYIYHVYHILYIYTITSRYFENVKIILAFSYIPYVGDIFKPQHVLRTDKSPPGGPPPQSDQLTEDLDHVRPALHRWLGDGPLGALRYESPMARWMEELPSGKLT